MNFGETLFNPVHTCQYGSHDFTFLGKLSYNSGDAIKVQPGEGDGLGCEKSKRRRLELNIWNSPERGVREQRRED